MKLIDLFNRRNKLILTLFLASISAMLLIVFHSIHYEEIHNVDENSKLHSRLRHYNSMISNKETRFSDEVGEKLEGSLHPLTTKAVWGKDFEDESNATVLPIEYERNEIRHMNYDKAFLQINDPSSYPTSLSKSFSNEINTGDMNRYKMLNNPSIVSDHSNPTDTRLGIETKKNDVFTLDVGDNQRSGYESLTKQYLSSLQTQLIELESFEPYDDHDNIGELYRILSAGTPCQPKPSLDAKRELLVNTITDMITSSSIGRIFYEISAIPSYLSLSTVISTASTDITTILLQISSDSDTSSNINLNTIFVKNIDHCHDLNRSSNFLIGRSLGLEINGLVSRYSCVQYIEDLSILISDLLPFEFEQLIGRLLCRCEYTLMPNELQTNSYFSYWDSISDLVDKAMESLPEGLCNISLDSTFDKSFGVKMKYNSYTIAQRLNSTNQDLNFAISDTDMFISIDQLLDYDFDAFSLQSLFSSISILSYDAMQSIVSMQSSSLSSSSSLFTTNGIYKSISYENLTDCKSILWFLSNYVLIGSEVAIKSSMSTLIRRPHKSHSIHLSDNENSVSDSSSSSSLSVSKSSSADMQSTSNGTDWELSYDKIKKMIAENSSSSSSGGSATSSESISTSSHISRRLLSYYSKRSHSKSEDSSDGDGYESSNSNNNNIAIDFPMDGIDISGSDLGEFEDIHDDWNKTLSSLDMKKMKTFSSSKLFHNTLKKYHLRSLQEREQNSYNRWLSILQSEHIDSPSLIYLFGRQITLLSIKLSQKYMDKNTLLVSVLTDAIAINTHQRLVDSRKLVNNILCFSQIAISDIGAWIRSPERSCVAIVEADIFINILTQVLSTVTTHSCSVSLMDEALAYFLSIGYDVYIEIPSPILIKAIIYSLLGRNHICSPIIASKYISYHSILSSAIQKLSNAHVEYEFLSSENNFASKESQSTNIYPSLLSTIIHVKVSYTQKPNHIAIGSNGVSIYTLLQFGVVAKYRLMSFRLMLEMPVWYLTSDQLQDLNTWNVYLYILTKPYKPLILSMKYIPSNQNQNIHEDTIRSSMESNSIESDIHISKLFYRTLLQEFDKHKTELSNGRFSLVEYDSSYGYLSTRIANTYKNATVISIERNAIKSKYHYRMLQSRNISNNVLCVSILEDNLIHRYIYDSPELFRFQLRLRGLLDEFLQSYTIPIDTTTITSKYSTPSRSNWGQVIGQILSSALTTYLYIPLSYHISYAYYIFYSGIVRIGFQKPYRPYDRDRDTDFFQTNNQKQFDLFQNITRWNSILCHPIQKYTNFEQQWVIHQAVYSTDAYANLSVEPMTVQIHYNSIESNNRIVNLPIFRFDIMNMSRSVHHHYDYIKDGHTRTYLMHIEVNRNLTDTVQNYFRNIEQPPLSSDSYNNINNNNNNVITSNIIDISLLDSISNSSGIILQSNSNDVLNTRSYILPPGYHPNQHQIVLVGIHRDKDNFFIPYTTIYGITLISVLRMGLIPEQREAYFKRFLKLPLYEDMAPWNIVFMGSDLDYIDYDTKDFTFDTDIKKAYQIMTVLMNYKRTIEDFDKCGSKASTVYGLPYVSECVGKSKSESSFKCNDLKKPVPCGDGQCYSDYITCLRAISNEAESLASAAFGMKA